MLVLISVYTVSEDWC